MGDLQSGDPGVPGPLAPGGELRETLSRAVAAGIITRDQAGRVAALAGPGPLAGPPGPLAETGLLAGAPSPFAEPGPPAGASAPLAEPDPHSGVGSGRSAAGPVLAEVLGYLGGAITIVTAIVLGNELWGSLAVAVRVLVLVAVTAAAVGAGAGLRGHEGPVGRLGGFLWLIAVAALAGTVGVAADGLLGWETRDTVLASCLVGLVAAVVMWWLRHETLQQIAMFAGVFSTVIAVLDRLDPHGLEFAPIAIWLIGLGWLAATVFAGLRPVAVGWVLGSAAAAFGLLFVDFADWPRSPMLVVAVLSGIALVIVGVRTQRWPVVAIAVVGLMFAVPMTLGELFGTALLPVWVALGIGLALLVGAVVVVMQRPRTRTSRVRGAG